MNQDKMSNILNMVSEKLPGHHKKDQDQQNDDQQQQQQQNSNRRNQGNVQGYNNGSQDDSQVPSGMKNNDFETMQQNDDDYTGTGAQFGSGRQGNMAQQDWNTNADTQFDSSLGSNKQNTESYGSGVRDKASRRGMGSNMNYNDDDDDDDQYGSNRQQRTTRSSGRRSGNNMDTEGDW
ncbi:hypothetical protein C6P45_003938 [Maudiozyma exigua]|uniref:Uncharacterized protein n=1 Tax=Maudiozyma exigua TaxID=34358 RepID=A0A9P6WDD2_MAUEX|nr:hypothetical protein C6P45_003938 [Kazachstania exigua]